MLGGRLFGLTIGTLQTDKQIRKSLSFISSDGEIVALVVRAVALLYTLV
jgi:hypothetical protein